MSVDGVELRVATAADAAGLAELAQASADGGAVGYRVREHVPSPDGVRADGSTVTTFVAVDPQGSVRGSARVATGRTRYAGRERSYARLGALAVHPGARRQGIAAALARRRIEHARSVAGDDVVVLADIQKGNVGSLAAARRWATGFTAPSVSAPVPVRRRAPRRAAGLVLRDAVAGDLPAIVAGHAAFTAGRDFSRPWTPASLAAWLAESPLPDPVHAARVAVDADGAIVAGIALRDEGRLRSMEIVRLPLAIRVANLVLRVVPRDRILRNIVVEHLWFAPGRLDAARALWEDTRWVWRDRGSTLLATLDARDPARRALGLRPWSPTTSLTTAVLADPAPDPARLVDSLE